MKSDFHSFPKCAGRLFQPPRVILTFTSARTTATNGDAWIPCSLSCRGSLVRNPNITNRIDVTVYNHTNAIPY